MKTIWSKLSSSDIRHIISILYVSMVLGFIYLLALRAVPKENESLVNVIAGAVVTNVNFIMSYFFGDKKGAVPDNKKSENEQP